MYRKSLTISRVYSQLPAHQDLCELSHDVKADLPEILPAWHSLCRLKLVWHALQARAIRCLKSSTLMNNQLPWHLFTLKWHDTPILGRQMMLHHCVHWNWQICHTYMSQQIFYRTYIFKMDCTYLYLVRQVGTSLADARRFGQDKAK